MKCPNCKKGIDKVIVTSKCWQYGYLEQSPTNKLKYRIADYSSVEEIYETISITCPEYDMEVVVEE